MLGSIAIGALFSVSMGAPSSRSPSSRSSLRSRSSLLSGHDEQDCRSGLTVF
jgi:hypothetical protein